MTDVAEVEQPPELEHVPTLAELHRDGLALARGWNAAGKPTHFAPTDAGHKMLGTRCSAM